MSHLYEDKEQPVKRRRSKQASPAPKLPENFPNIAPNQGQSSSIINEFNLPMNTRLQNRSVSQSQSDWNSQNSKKFPQNTYNSSYQQASLEIIQPNQQLIIPILNQNKSIMPQNPPPLLKHNSDSQQVQFGFQNSMAFQPPQDKNLLSYNQISQNSSANFSVGTSLNIKSNNHGSVNPNLQNNEEDFIQILQQEKIHKTEGVNHPDIFQSQSLKLRKNWEFPTLQPNQDLFAHKSTAQNLPHEKSVNSKQFPAFRLESSNSLINSDVSNGPPLLDSFFPQQIGTNIFAPKEIFWIWNDQQTPEDYPTTVSKHWHPSHSLKSKAPNNLDFTRNVDSLVSMGFVGWKRSRGDGNCYYRAVAYQYVEYLLKPYTPENLSQFISRIESEQWISHYYPQFKEYKTRALQWLQWLYQFYKENKLQAFKEFLKIMQNTDFDDLIIKMIRMLAAEFIMKNFDEIFVLFGEDQRELVETSLTSGEEVKDSILLAVPSSLGIQVVMYMFFNQIVETPFPYDEQGFKIHIVRNSGHYDILYQRKAWLEEGYDFSKNTYLMKPNYG